MSGPRRRSGLTGFMWAWMLAIAMINIGAATLRLYLGHKPLTGLVPYLASYAIVTGLGIIILSIVPWRRY